jgi:multidrug efflux pump subunit AcrB
MNLANISVKRPVFTVMIAAAILVLGLLGLKNIGTDLYPDVSFPVVVVTIPYPGAGPDEVEEQISKHVEESVNGIAGIDRVKSESREGVSITTALFKLGTNIENASSEVRERVSQVRYKLPQNVKEPIVGRFDVAQAPVLIYTIQSQRSLADARYTTRGITLRFSWPMIPRCDVAGAC